MLSVIGPHCIREKTGPMWVPDTTHSVLLLEAPFQPYSVLHRFASGYKWLGSKLQDRRNKDTPGRPVCLETCWEGLYKADIFLNHIS